MRWLPVCSWLEGSLHADELLSIGALGWPPRRVRRGPFTHYIEGGASGGRAFPNNQYEPQSVGIRFIRKLRVILEK